MNCNKKEPYSSKLRTKAYNIHLYTMVKPGNIN